MKQDKFQISKKTTFGALLKKIKNLLVKSQSIKESDSMFLYIS